MASGMVHLVGFPDSAAVVEAFSAVSLLDFESSCLEERWQALKANASVTINVMNLYGSFMMFLRFGKV
jgi:hypothetical protein